MRRFLCRTLLGLATLGTLAAGPVAFAEGAARTVTVRTAAGAKSYRVGKQLGSGGWGTVYEGHGPHGESVAIKLSSREDPEGNFDHEVRMMEKHGGKGTRVPSAIGVGQVDGSPHERALVMERVGTSTVLSAFDSTPVAPRPVGEALHIAGQVLDTLSAIHAKGDRHNDAYPGNWRIDDDGKVFLIDLQRVGPISDRLRKGHPWVTYHAPEVVNGSSLAGSVASDVFTVAVGIVAMLTGKRDPTPADLSSPEIPDWLRPVLAKGMEPDPLKRYATPAEFKSALQLAHSAARAHGQ